MRWLFVPAAVMSLAFVAPAATAASGGAPSSAQQLAQNSDRDQGKTPGNPAGQKPQPGARRPAAAPSQRSLGSQQRYDWHTYQPGKRPPEWRVHRDFNRQLWQRNVRAPRQYHLTPYRRPTGWYAKRWAFGMVLPQLFWARDHWVDQYWMFGLENPPYGYVWVRNGDDALLVNVATGYILQVVYGLFD